MPTAVENRVHEILRDCQDQKGLSWAKDLFWSCLEYDMANDLLSLPEKVRLLAVGDPLVLASKNDFKVLYIGLNSDIPRITDERQIANALLPAYPYCLFLFSNRDQDHWHLVNVKPLADRDRAKQRVFRRMTLSREERLRTAVERLSLLRVGPEDDTVLKVQRKCDEAFDVERVTKEFYKGYVQVFDGLQKILRFQVTGTKGATWAHDYALQLLNRLMFLYFIQRKKWIGAASDFVRGFWGAYKASGQPKDTFFQNWLSVLFFEAFNKKFDAASAEYRARFPAAICAALSSVPYLNGGLFTPSTLDTDYMAEIPDSFFPLVFDQFQGDSPGFMERYNFTISEDTPLDQEVAVDPEMIGRVYESLVNVTSEGISEDDQRGEAGIFYTPRVEIDLMCRLSLVDRLANEVGQEHRPLIYQVLFAFGPEDKEESDRLLGQAGLWPAVRTVVREMSVVDPACGSGSFLVGMLLVLDDLLSRANKAIDGDESAYQRRKGIISRNLYGVDVMEWAVQVAELRLWLQLVVETDIDLKEVQTIPLLPSLWFNIRAGDSLLQEVGGLNFGSGFRSGSGIHPTLQRKTDDLKERKLRFSMGLSKEITQKALEAEERSLFRTILESQVAVLREGIRELQFPKTQNGFSFGMAPSESVTKAEDVSKRIAEKERELSQLEKAVAALDADRVPFVWSLAFVEIFSGSKHGFDIVIGNPPYVRHEKIADPHEVLDRDTYKEKIAESVAMSWPFFFKDHKVDGQSDLYIYFYFYTLGLLTERGTFCFITSNSWLDVAFGKTLQEFLLRDTHVQMVIDNRVKRSFAQAGINTVIVLLSKPRERGGDAKTARFVLTKVPFEEVLSPIIFTEIEETASRQDWPEFRCIARSQKSLIEEGSDGGRYVGNKWGGRYFRAPDVYWTIMGRAWDRLVPLEGIAEVRYGIKTGANDFFFVRVLGVKDGTAHLLCDDGSEHDIEAACVTTPVITKPKEIPGPRVVPQDLPYRLVRIDKASAKLPLARAYIKWGESQGFHLRSSTKSRSLWCKIEDRVPSHILIPRRHKRRPVIALSDGVDSADNQVEIWVNDSADVTAIAGSVYSLFTLMIYEIFGRANFGLGVLETQKYEVATLPVLNPRKIPADILTQFAAAFQEVADRPALMVYDEVNQASRRHLEDLFLQALGFTDAGERTTVMADLQDAVCRTIWARMAKSGNSRESRMSYDEWVASGTSFGQRSEEEETDDPEEE